MKLEFWKLHGCGNDYLFMDVRNPPALEPDWPRLAQRLSDRRWGVGADGLITINAAAGHDARMRIFNADGSESEMCGNGLRAMAKWLYDRGEAGRAQSIVTGAGVLYPDVVEAVQGRAVRIRVNMGSPRFSGAAVGMTGDPGQSCECGQFSIEGENLTGHWVSMGNPHVVFFGALWSLEQMARRGPLLERHVWFRHRINVHSAEILDRHRMRMRHWERGSGITMACGTGATGGAILASRLRLVEMPAVVEVPGGELVVEWSGQENAPAFLTGPAEEVFHGFWEWNGT